jgi:hypothetical protein
MSRRKQSTQDQVKRVGEGCCPVHGLFMSQTGLLAERFYIASCPRKDCGMMAISKEPGEILTLITGVQLTRLEQLWRKMHDEFVKQAGDKIEVELLNVATSPEVQLPLEPA